MQTEDKTVIYSEAQTQVQEEINQAEQNIPIEKGQSEGENSAQKMILTAVTQNEYDNTTKDPNVHVENKDEDTVSPYTPYKKQTVGKNPL